MCEINDAVRHRISTQFVSLFASDERIINHVNHVTLRWSDLCYCVKTRYRNWTTKIEHRIRAVVLSSPLPNTQSNNVFGFQRRWDCSFFRLPRSRRSSRLFLYVISPLSIYFIQFFFLVFNFWIVSGEKTDGYCWYVGVQAWVRLMGLQRVGWVWLPWEWCDPSS